MGKHLDKHEIHKNLGRREDGVDFESHVGIWEFTLPPTPSPVNCYEALILFQFWGQSSIFTSSQKI